MAMEVEVEIAIMGGGLGGLALAVGLQERFIEAHVFEKAPQRRKHSGTAISIATNGIRALEGLKPGLSSKMRGAGAGVRQVTALIRLQGQPERAITRQESPEKLFMIPWKLAAEMLAEEISDSTAVHWQHSFLDYEPVEGGVKARFEVQTEQEDGSILVEEKVVKAKLLIGADGIRSQVRKVVVGDEPRDLLLITWNAIVPTDPIRSLELHKENEIKFIMYTDRRLTVYQVDCGAGYTLWQVRGPDESGDITKAYNSDAELYGRDVRKVRALKQIEGLEELQNLRTAMEGTDPDGVRESRSVDRLPLTSWADSSGRVLLIGDAAHGKYSGPGEGARTAFEDAHQLSVLLHEAYSTKNPECAVLDAVKRVRDGRRLLYSKIDYNEASTDESLPRADAQLHSCRFQEQRIPRCTRIQSFAAESTGFPQFIPEWVQELSPEEKRTRGQQFQTWTQKYPSFLAGDPESTYWKPL